MRASAAAISRGGGTTTISGGATTANGGQYGAGIGGGYSGDGGTTTLDGGTTIATGGPLGAGIGSGALRKCRRRDRDRGRRGRHRDGWPVGDRRRRRPGLRLADHRGDPARPVRSVHRPRLESGGAEVVIGPSGKLLGGDIDPTAGASISGGGQIANQGVIALAAPLVGLTVTGNNSLITFDEPASTR